MTVEPVSATPTGKTLSFRKVITDWSIRASWHQQTEILNNCIESYGIWKYFHRHHLFWSETLTMWDEVMRYFPDDGTGVREVDIFPRSLNLKVTELDFHPGVLNLKFYPLDHGASSRNWSKHLKGYRVDLMLHAWNIFLSNILVLLNYRQEKTSCRNTWDTG